MRILFVSFHYPPDPSIGAVRPAALVASLRSWGHQVTVITAAGDGSREVLSEAGVVRTGWLDLRRFKVRRKQDQTTRRSPSPSGNNSAETHDAPRERRRPAILRPGSPLRRWGAKGRANLIEVPDELAGWILPAIAAALHVASTDGWDLIIASGPPFAAMMVAHRVAQRLGIPWIADYRDLWSMSSYYSRSAPRRKIDFRIERRSISNCAGAITVSAPLAEDLRREFNIPVRQVINGYDPTQVVPLEQRSPLSEARLNLLYVGNSFYGGLRSPAVMFAAARQLGLSPADIRFHFVGSDPELVARFASVNDAEKLVTVHAEVPREEALEMQARADALLLLLWNDPGDAGTYTGKLFEYVAVRRPIVLCGYAHGVAADLIRDRGLGMVADDVESASAALVSLLESKEDNFLLPDLDPRLRVGLSREDQNLQLQTLINEVSRMA